MYQRYQDRAGFLFVYIQEAHPADGWQMQDNIKDGVVFAPKSYSERRDVAKACCSSLRLTFPTVVDTAENVVDELYAAWPERLFVLDPDNRIVYAGKQGPWGFKPAEAEKALHDLLK